MTALSYAADLGAKNQKHDKNWAGTKASPFTSDESANRTIVIFGRDPCLHFLDAAARSRARERCLGDRRSDVDLVRHDSPCDCPVEADWYVAVRPGCSPYPDATLAGRCYARCHAALVDPCCARCRAALGDPYCGRNSAGAAPRDSSPDCPSVDHARPSR